MTRDMDPDDIVQMLNEMFDAFVPIIFEYDGVVDKFIGELNLQLSGKRVVLQISPEARTWLARRGYDPRYGARPLSRVIQLEIKDALTDEILFGRLEKGGQVSVDCDDDGLTFTYGERNAPTVQ